MPLHPTWDPHLFCMGSVWAMHGARTGHARVTHGPCTGSYGHRTFPHECSNECSQPHFAVRMGPYTPHDGGLQRRTIRDSRQRMNLLPLEIRSSTALRRLQGGKGPRHVLTGNYYGTSADLHVYGYTTAVRIGGDPWSRDRMMSSSELGKLVGIHP